MFAFLGRTTTYLGTEGYRLKTMKMAGCVSQGLALPLHMFPELSDAEIGKDVTELLSVIKYDVAEVVQDDKPGLKAANAERSFPSFIPKTDQERLQNLTSYFHRHRRTAFEETLKLDGSSMTCYKIITPHGWFKQKILVDLLGFNIAPSTSFGVCSRNLQLRKPKEGEPSSDFWKVAIEQNIEKALPAGYAIQGELIGPKIQNNHEKVDKLDYYVFDVYDINNSRYLLPQQRIRFVKEFLEPFGIKHVPILGYTTIFCDNTDIPSMLERVKGESINPGTISEGRVYKALEHHGVTFKVINNEYLLKSEK